MSTQDITSQREWPKMLKMSFNKGDAVLCLRMRVLRSQKSTTGHLSWVTLRAISMTGEV